jgi:hypothetical protein
MESVQEAFVEMGITVAEYITFHETFAGAAPQLIDSFLASLRDRAKGIVLLISLTSLMIWPKVHNIIIALSIHFFVSHACTMCTFRAYIALRCRLILAQFDIAQKLY